MTSHHSCNNLLLSVNTAHHTYAKCAGDGGDYEMHSGAVFSETVFVGR